VTIETPLNSAVDKLAIIYATGLFVGHIKRFAQSIASLLTLIFFYFVREYFPFNNNLFFLLFLLMTTVLAIPAAGRTEVIYKQKDSRKIVIDDIIGTFIVVFGFCNLSLFFMAVGFVLFRVYDNLNVFPINKIEKLPRGWGVVMDDVVAGLMANLSIRFLMWIFPIS